MNEILELKYKIDPTYEYETFLNIHDKWYSSYWQCHVSNRYSSIQEDWHLFCTRVLLDFDAIHGITFGFPVDYENIIWKIWIKEQIDQDKIETALKISLPLDIVLSIISFL